MTTENLSVGEEQSAGRMSSVERIIAANTPSLFLRRYWRQILGMYVLLVALGGGAGYALDGWSIVETTRLVATAPYWGLGWLVEQSPLTLFGVAAVLLAGYALLEYYVPERFFEGSYVSMVWPLALTGIALSAIVWTPAYLRAVVGVTAPALVQSPVAAVLVFAQPFVAPILTRLVWSDKTRLLDRSLLAHASEAGDQPSTSLLQVARDESIPLAGESFRPIVWLYLGWFSVISFGVAVVFEDVLLTTLPASVALIVIGMPTLVAVLYLGWRTIHFARASAAMYSD